MLGEGSDTGSGQVRGVVPVSPVCIIWVFVEWENLSATAGSISQVSKQCLLELGKLIG